MTGPARSMTCAAGRVNVLFTADLFNEGVDLPDVDTVLFLRPTESATIFLQQLGRGLRRHMDKAVLTALDFVGHQRKEFRFDVRYRALTGADQDAGSSARSRRVSRSCRPAARSSSTEQAQDIVLANIRAQVTTRWTQMVGELRACGEPNLAALPPRVRARAQRRPAPGPRSGPGCGARPPPDTVRQARARASSSSACGPSPTSTTRTAPPPTSRLLSDDAPHYDALDPEPSGSLGCCSSRCGPTVAASPSYADGLESLRVGARRSSRDERGH